MLRTIVAAVLALLAVPAAAQAEPVPVPCERTCMEDLAGKLLDAFAAHDANRLPLAPGARYTEIGQEMGFDNGLWQTASKARMAERPAVKALEGYRPPGRSSRSCSR